MIEMKVDCCAAHDAFSGVSFPDLEFYRSWDESSPGGIEFRGDGEVFFAFHGFEFELGNVGASAILRFSAAPWIGSEIVIPADPTRNNRFLLASTKPIPR